jgi:endoglucanase
MHRNEMLFLLVAGLLLTGSEATMKHGHPLSAHAHAARHLPPVIAQPEKDQTAFVRLAHPEFMGPARVRYAPPSRTRPISALVLAETSLDPRQPGGAIISPELIVNPGPHGLPVLSSMAPMRKTTNASQSGTAPTSFTTTSVSYTHAEDGQAYITELVINNVRLRGTFANQLLPIDAYRPEEVTGRRTYANLVADSFWFYEQQRCVPLALPCREHRLSDPRRSGLLPWPRRALWRNNSALHDGLDWGVDLTGGYYDAGDYLL